MTSTPSLTATSATERSPLMEQLGRRVDANRDGQVTSAEFANFLEGLTQALDAEQTHTASSAMPAPAAGAQTLPVQEPVMTPAQASALLRQAFEPVTRSR